MCVWTGNKILCDLVKKAFHFLYLCSQKKVDQKLLHAITYAINTQYKLLWHYI